ncbi:AraC family transcriptional regulator [Chromohalobacter marismortui]|uniref:AraC family transcriptional regulator n=1 Tax=Chromohalobacter marismortui TaxID=42055 RepID=A0A4R7NUG5_9GAMM|nr:MULTISPECIES: AraC family transcriptional regulator [Chromohalobacter]MCI0510659.1 AraC family transcriptional regulator [Chromohalobacter sp.]MCI0591974.1 AraC family transcriptional regulator [Chromohalobacter sp.]TDU24764.1 AraC family transcriptional regulator [Chromohalobacter marismortui]
MSTSIRLTPLDNTVKHHDHAFHQIVIGLAGHAEFEIEGLGGSIAPLSGCIVPINHVHYYEGIGDNRQLILDLPDDSPSLTGSHRELASLFDAPRYFTLDDPLRNYLNFVVQEMSQPRHADGELLATTFLSCLHARLSTATTLESGRALNLDIIDRYIDTHIAERVTVKDLASLACLSEAHFGERFRRHTGLTPYQYLLRRRLDRASTLLRTAGVPLTEIAARTGFANQSALSHAFRRHHGQSPSQWRRAATSSVMTTSSIID